MIFVLTLSMSRFYPLWLGRPTFAPTTPPRIKDFRGDFIHEPFLSSVGRSANICPDDTTDDKGLPWLDSTSAAPGTLLLRECTTAGGGTRRYGKKAGGCRERSQVGVGKEAGLGVGKEARAAPPR